MGPIEIITIVLSVLVVGGVITWEIVKKKKGKSCCGHQCQGCKHNCTHVKEEEKK